MNQTLLETISAIGMAFGIFGNVNVIVAICRKKILRTKGAMFVLILSAAHLICNISEIIGISFHFRFRPMAKKACFEYNVVYFIAMMFQSAFFFSMSLDVCFSILLPIKHMIWKKSRYVASMCIFPTIFAVATALVSFIFIPDEETPYCIFLLTTDIHIYQMVSSSLIVLNTTTLVILIFSVICAVKKSENMRGSRHSSSSRANSLREEKHKMFRSTFFLVLIYIISWWAVVITFRIIIEFANDVNEAVRFIPYLVIFVIPNFCQTYFVTYARSPRFRKAFREQLHWLFCGMVFSETLNKKASRKSKLASATNSANGQQAFSEKGKEETKGSRESQKSVRLSIQVTV